MSFVENPVSPSFIRPEMHHELDGPEVSLTKGTCSITISHKSYPLDWLPATHSQVFSLINELVYVSVEAETLELRRKLLDCEPANEAAVAFRFNHLIAPGTIVVQTQEAPSNSLTRINSIQKTKGFLLVPLCSGHLVKIDLPKDASLPSHIGEDSGAFTTYNFLGIGSEPGVGLISFKFLQFLSVPQQELRGVYGGEWASLSVVSSDGYIYSYRANLSCSDSPNLEIKPDCRVIIGSSSSLGVIVSSLLKGGRESQRHLSFNELVIAQTQIANRIVAVLTRGMVLKIVSFREEKIIQEFNMASSEPEMLFRPFEKAYMGSQSEGPLTTPKYFAQIQAAPLSKMQRNTKEKMFFDLTLLVNVGSSAAYFQINCFSVKVSLNLSHDAANEIEHIPIDRIDENSPFWLGIREKISIESSFAPEVPMASKMVPLFFSQNSSQLAVVFQQQTELKPKHVGIYNRESGFVLAQVIQSEDFIWKAIRDCRQLLKLNPVTKKKSTIESVSRILASSLLPSEVLVSTLAKLDSENCSSVFSSGNNIRNPSQFLAFIQEKYKEDSVGISEGLNHLFDELLLTLKALMPIETVCLPKYEPFFPILVRKKEQLGPTNVSTSLNRNSMKSNNKSSMPSQSILSSTSSSKAPLVCFNSIVKCSFEEAFNYLLDFKNSDLICWSQLEEAEETMVLVWERIIRASNAEADCSLEKLDPFVYLEWVLAKKRSRKMNWNYCDLLSKKYSTSGITEEERNIIQPAIKSIMENLEKDLSFYKKRSNDEKLTFEQVLSLSVKNQYGPTLIANATFHRVRALASSAIKTLILLSSCSFSGVPIPELVSEKPKMNRIRESLPSFISLGFVLGQYSCSSFSRKSLSIAEELLFQFSEQILSSLVPKSFSNLESWIDNSIDSVLLKVFYVVPSERTAQNFAFFSEFLIRLKEYRLLLEWAGFLVEKKQKDILLEFRKSECFLALGLHEEFLESIGFVAISVEHFTTFHLKGAEGQQQREDEAQSSLIIEEGPEMSNDSEPLDQFIDVSFYQKLLFGQTENEESPKRPGGTNLFFNQLFERKIGVEHKPFPPQVSFELALRGILSSDGPKISFYLVILKEFLKQGNVLSAYNLLMTTVEEDRKVLVDSFIRLVIEGNQTHVFATLPGTDFLFDHVVYAISTQASETLGFIQDSSSNFLEVFRHLERIQVYLSIIFDVYVANGCCYEAGLASFYLASHIETLLELLKENFGAFVEVIQILLNCLNLSLHCLSVSQYSQSGFMLAPISNAESFAQSLKRKNTSEKGDKMGLISIDTDEFYKGFESATRFVTIEDIQGRIVEHEVRLYLTTLNKEPCLEELSQRNDQIIIQLIALHNEQLALRYCRYHSYSWEAFVKIMVYQYLEVVCKQIEYQRKEGPLAPIDQERFLSVIDAHWEIIKKAYKEFDRTPTHKVMLKVVKNMFKMGAERIPKELRDDLFQVAPTKLILFFLRYDENYQFAPVTPRISLFISCRKSLNTSLR